MARVPNWGPSAGQPVPDDQWQAYMAANPPPEGGSFVAAPAVQPQGSTGATLGGAVGTEQATPGIEQNTRPWRDFYMSQYGASRPGILLDTTNQDQARLEQQQVIQALQRQAAGDLNSQAQQQLGQSYGQARAQQSSLGSTMRGQSAGAAMRGIQQGQAGIQRGFAGDQQMLMLQEQQAAQALLAQMLQQQRQQDMGLAEAGAQTALQGRGLDDALRQFYLGGAGQADIAEAQRGADIARAQMGIMDARNAIYQQLGNSLMQGAASGVSTAASLGKSKPA